MKVEVIMPKMGESITEGTLIKWYKKKGDAVKKDEIIYEISTDKVDTEIPSPADGILVDIKVNEQETVEVGKVVAILDSENDATVVQNKSTASEFPSTHQVGGEIIDVPMPKMGESIMEGTILKWFKKVGNKVQTDEIIFEISTDKVDTEVPSPAEGILKEILFKENETVKVGDAVARIITSTGIVKQKLQPVEEVKEKQTNVPMTNDKSLITNRFYSPLVLNIARTVGIDMSELESIPGTGISGRLSKNDLLKYIERKKTGVVSPLLEEKPEELKFDKLKVGTSKRVEILPMNNNRQKVMQHMVASKNTSVHVTAMIEVDMSSIYNFVEKNRDKFATEGIKLTYMPFISFAVIRALKEFPMMNASLDGNNILIKNYINLGIAVAVEPNGLIVPNIKNADEKNIRGLAKAIADLGVRSRTKKLIPDDVMDGTFSITNYGVFGSLFGTPIINQPEVGILGVGTITKKPVVIENNGTESIGIKPMMYLSLSHDHRLVDGMLGGKFLKFVKDFLENFDTSVI